MFHLEKEQAIDRYRVVEPINDGAYAESYKVTDAQGNLYFLKLINYAKLISSQFTADGNVQEIEIAAQLHHPHICQYVDSGDVIACGQKFAFLVLEYVQGETVMQRAMNATNVSISAIKQIAIEVLEALKYLHNLPVPIIHNEVTIQNVMLNAAGKGREQAKLIDFGHARYLNQSVNRAPFAGISPFYLAPECQNGVCCVQSDLFSMGAFIYHLVFGIVPWYFDITQVEPSDLLAVFTAVRQQPLQLPNVEALAQIDPTLPVVLQKALSQDIDERFQTADEFIAALSGKVDAAALQTAILQSNPTATPTAAAEPQTVADTVAKTAAKGKKKAEKKGRGLKDVAGMEEVKKMLETGVVNILKNPEKTQKYKLNIPNGLLLYGPPGCGKCFLAEKLAEEIDYNYVYIKASDLASIYVQGLADKIAQIFAEARKNAPVILCIEDFESLVPNRAAVNGAAAATGEVSEFLAQLEDCGQKGVFVIACSNLPDLINPAILRRGRIDKLIYVPVPDQEARAVLFKMYLKDRPCAKDIDCQRLAELTDKYVSSDIAYIVNEAAMNAAISDDKITMENLEKVIAENSPSVKPELLKYYKEVRDKLTGVKNAAITRPHIGFK